MTLHQQSKRTGHIVIGDKTEDIPIAILHHDLTLYLRPLNLRPLNLRLRRDA
jgi:hypothetical protein